MEFIGVRQSENAPTTYFSVRVKSDAGESIPTACDLTLHWKDRDFVVREITTSNLVAAGIETQPQEYKGPGAQSAFIGGADSQNRDYGIEFDLQSNRIVQFYARHNWRSSVQCPFELSVPSGSRIRFPLSEDELKKHFGEPESITAVWGK